VSFTTDLLDIDGLFSEDSDLAENQVPGAPASPPQARLFGDLPERPGVYRQLFLTVWRGVDGGPSSFHFDPAAVRFCVGQRERCPTCDVCRAHGGAGCRLPHSIHEHYWICFSNPVRLNTALSQFVPPLIQGGYRGERVWGTNAAVHAYVTKVLPDAYAFLLQVFLSRLYLVY